MKRGEVYRLKPKIAKKLFERKKGMDRYGITYYDNSQYNRDMIHFLIDDEGKPIPRTVLKCEDFDEDNKLILFYGLSEWKYRKNHFEKCEANNPYKRGQIVEYEGKLWMVTKTIGDEIVELQDMNKKRVREVSCDNVEKAKINDDGDYLTKNQFKKIKEGDIKT